MNSTIKVIQDIPVAYIAKSGFPSAVAEKAFWELEQKVPLRGNKFFGVFDQNKNEYRACVAITETNQSAIKDLDHGVIQGGTYACTTLTGSYYDILRRIKPAFDALLKEHKQDLSRPSVEFYKRLTEAVVMLPVLQ